MAKTSVRTKSVQKQPQSKPTSTALSFRLRPGIEEETNVLNRALQYSDVACQGILSGSLDAGKGNSISRMTRDMIGAVKQNIVDRTLAAKLVAQEALDVTASKSIA